MADRPLFSLVDYAVRRTAALLPERAGYAMTRRATERLGGSARRWIGAEVERQVMQYLGDAEAARTGGQRFVAELACDDLDAITAVQWTRQARLAATRVQGAERLPEKGPAILVSFHFSGGFRVFDVLCSRGLQPTFLHAPPRDPQGYENRIERLRRDFLTKTLKPGWIVPGPGARDALANHLEEGGVVVALLDVAPGALTLRDRAKGTLLGRPVDLPVGILRLALEKGAPVIPYDGWLDGNRRVLEFHEPARGSDPETLLQEILATCEGVIRNRPWTWQAWLDADRLWATAQED